MPGPLLEPRGHAAIDSDNRAECRRELCALGLPSAYVRALPLARLSEIYNDTTNGALHAAIEESNAAAPTAGLDIATRAPAPTPDVAAAAAALAAALAAATPHAAPIDAESVRVIVRAETAGLHDAIAALSNRAAPVTVTINNARTGQTTTLDGPQHHRLPFVLRVIDGLRPHHRNVWLSGPAGTGKSSFARQIATTRGLEYRSIGAITSSYQLLGFRDATGNVARTPFRDMWEHGGVFCWDDVDSSDPAALIEFNEATANGICNFPDGPVFRHADTVVVATANTTGDGGTAQYLRTRQDAATLDRFRRIYVGYDKALEQAITDSILPAIESGAWCDYWHALRASADKLGLRVVLSMRGLISGADLLAAGLSVADVLAVNLADAMPRDQYDRLVAGAGTPPTINAERAA